MPFRRHLRSQAPPQPLAPPVLDQGPLPVELVRGIMIMDMENRIGNLNPKEAPLLFLQICRLWSRIANTTPQLWSSLAVLPGHWYPNCGLIVRQWLERTERVSKTLPLIELTIFLFAGPATPIQRLPEVLAATIPVSYRVEYFQLALPCHVLPILLSNPSAELTSLRTLKLWLSEQPEFTLHSSATSLRNVSLILERAFIPLGDTFDLLWPQISFLEIHTLRGMVTCVYDLITRCSALDTLAIIAISNPAIPYIPFHAQRPLLSPIRHLFISANTRSGAIGYFLDGLKLPSLNSLQLAFITGPYNYGTDLWPSEAIISLRGRSIAQLKSLIVLGHTVHEDSLIDLALRINTLEQLMVANGGINYVTPYVAQLLPQSDQEREERHLAYLEELETAS
jgi:hypothetical protein